MLRQRIGVIENKNSGFEANIVLEQVLPILVCVPFKAHADFWREVRVAGNKPLCQYYCMYTMNLGSLNASRAVTRD